MRACPRPGGYVPRQTHECDAAVLVRRHLPGFLARLEEGGHALPDFIKKELEGFAGCGDFERGFVRTACRTCGDEQRVHTVDMDTPLAPADFFDPAVTVGQLGAFMGVDNPPMYVQSLTYGRRAVFSIESSQTVDEVQAALSATIQAVAEVNVDVAYKYKKLLNESTMQVFVLGGSAEDGIHAVDGFQGLLTYIKNGAEFSESSPGAPIGYKLAYLDNFGTQFAYTTNFAEADCSFTPDKVRIALDRIYFHANGCDFWDKNCHQTYQIWVESPLGKQILASQDSPKFIDDGQTIGLGTVKDLVLPDANSSWLTVGFSADEDGLTVQTTKKFVYDGGWQNFGEQGITAKTPKGADEDLDVSLFFKVSEL